MNLTTTKMGLVEMLERFDPASVAAYREAVRLSAFYAPSAFKAKASHADAAQSARWRDTAHRVLRDALNEIKKRAA